MGGPPMIMEMRVYRCLPGRLPALMKRFDTLTLKLWDKHGIKQAGFFTTLIGTSNQELTYFVAWDSLADREKKWSAFQSDPDCIAGPCALESREHALEVASALKEIAGRLKIGLVYKTSFDKANRTSASAARGIGLVQALPIFAEISASLDLPVLTDVHDASQCAE